MKKTAYVWLLAGTVSVYATASALSHSSATGVVKQRMDAMVMLSNQIKLLSPMLVQNQPKDFTEIMSSAQIIARHGGTALSDLFPGDSINGPSEARPEIWSRWQEFQTLADELEKLGLELENSANASLNGALPVSAPPPPPDQPEKSEWEKLDVGSLLGIGPSEQPLEQTQIAQRQIDQIIQNSVVAVRGVSTIYSDILKACSSCHTAFRRSK